MLAEVADVQAHLPADGDAAPSVDQLRAVKRKFVELKDTFLSLQQRDGLMAAVSGPDVFARLGEETENTDEVLNEAKRRNKGLEDESEALTEEMRSHTAKLDKRTFSAAVACPGWEIANARCVLQSSPAWRLASPSYPARLHPLKRKRQRFQKLVPWMFVTKV